MEHTVTLPRVSLKNRLYGNLKAIEHTVTSPEVSPRDKMSGNLTVLEHSVTLPEVSLKDKLHGNLTAFEHTVTSPEDSLTDKTVRPPYGIGAHDDVARSFSEGQSYGNLTVLGHTVVLAGITRVLA